MTEITLILARYVVPVRPARTVLLDQAVAICGDKILAIMPAEQALRKFSGAREVHLRSHVLLPGFVNMHTHVPMTLMRGYADDVDLETWLNSRIWPLEQHIVDGDFVADGAMLGVVEMLRAGITCFNDNYFFPDRIAEVVDSTGIRACIGLPVIELPTRWAQTTDECIEKGLKLLEAWAGHPRITFAWAPHAPYSVSDATLGKLSRLAAGRGMPVHMHLLESRFDRRSSLQAHGVAPLERLARAGLLDDNLLAVHMTDLTDADISLLAERGVHVIHCPQSNLKLGSGLCPVSKLISASVNVAIGTDGAASNNDLSLLSEAQVAMLLVKGFAENPHAVDAFEALEMMTLNGARALKMEDRLGSIRPGCQADIVALDLGVPETQPVYDVVSQLVYSASSTQVTDVWVDGRRLLVNRELPDVEVGSVLRSADRWRAAVEDFRRNAALENPG